MAAIALGLVAAMSSQDTQAADALGKYKLDLSNSEVCKVYYTRAGKWQAAEDLVVGKCADGETDSIHAPYARLPYATDGEFVDCRGVGSEQVGDYDRTNFVGANQGFLVFDFGEKGIDFTKIVLYNDGYYQRHQQGTVFVGLYGDCSGETYADKDLVAENYNGLNGIVTDLLRTNGSKQKFADAVFSNKWMTGSVNPSENEPGSYAATFPTGSHNKYRYVIVYDWSNYFYLSEVEIYGVQLKTNTYSDAQLDLDRAIAEAQAFADEFAQSDADAVAALKAEIAAAQAKLDNNTTDETVLKEQISSLTVATTSFMSAITYQLGENEFYCSLSTPDGLYGLKLATETTTVGNYTGRALVTCDPADALSFSVNKGAMVNGQQAYQLSTAEGVLIQTGADLVFVDASQVTASNPAELVFTQRYSDGENAIYDMKAGDYFYYINEEGKLAYTGEFPKYEDYTEIIAYTFQLTASDYQKTAEEAAVNFKGWDFNDAAVEVTSVYGDVLGQNAGVLIDGWRFNKWRSYTRLAQETVNGSGYMVSSINNPYWARTDTLKQTPLIPEIDENSQLTSANNGIGLCREYGKYINKAAPDPIDQIRDSSNLIIVNPIYCPYIAIKMAGTSENVDLSAFGATFFIKKDAVEPNLNMTNFAGKKGDVYYWRLTDCGFTVGQVGYCAQYIGLNNAFKSTKDALVIDWIRPYASIDAIPEETISAADLTAIVATLPENPVYEAPVVEQQKVKYLSNLLSMKTADGTDVTADNAAALAAVYDEDLATAVPHGNYYVITLPEAIQDFATLKVYYKGGNDYSTNVLFYTDTELAIASDVESAYVPNGGALWQHNAFSGTVTKEDGCVSLFNKDRKKYTYIAIKGDNDGNPLSMTELELYYYEDADFAEYAALEEVDYWTLPSNWTSSRTNGKVEGNEDGSITVTSGTDNAKRGDIRNQVDKIYMQDHKVVFYTCELTNLEATQNFNDMKFGFTSLIKSFSETAVVNEQLLRGNSNQQYILEDGSQLVYFDIAGRNPNVSYFLGNSGEKFDGTKKDEYRAAFAAANDVVISNPNFTLIGSAETNFIIKKMGSAKDVETLINTLVSTGIRSVEAEKPVANQSKMIFDLKGNRMESISAPGLYIVNGKKILVK